jgi:hypothetical protein
MSTRELPPGWAAPAHRPDEDPLTETTLTERMHEGLARPFQRAAIPRATDHTIDALHERFAEVDHEALREEARRIRAHAIANLPDYLEQWIAAAEANGTTVHFAADDGEARRIAAAICAERGDAPHREVEVDGVRGGVAQLGAGGRGCRGGGDRPR